MVPGRVEDFNSDGQQGRCRLGGLKGLFLCCKLSLFFVLPSRDGEGLGGESADVCVPVYVLLLSL